VFEPPAGPWGPGHRGIDLAGTPGQSVLAVAPGTVAFTGSIAGIGIVVVQHGSVRSTYQPVEAAVRVGDHVDAGTRIGTLATPGSHCLPAACLHLGARRGDTYLDPLSLLADTPVRLKPWEGLTADVASVPGTAATPALRLSPGSGARVGLTIGST
jgi:murein DD-endopeptidase MepM/ murein hydrolase activator NlpD